MPYDSGGKWFGTVPSYGDGSDPPSPSEYGPPGKAYWEDQAARKDMAAKQQAGLNNLAARYEAAKNSAGRAYIAKTRALGRER